MTARAIVLFVALLALVAGCAGSGAGSFAPDPAAALVPASDLAGTWHGEYWWLGGSYWADEGVWSLQIAKDGSFTLTITPTAASNNLAKPSSWSGTVVSGGNRVQLRTSRGLWFTLARSGETLYGVANDPVTEADIEIKLDRTGRD
ncbi:MAG TPA: hypothetical protein VJX92_00805 [Methylomirabilota bacterium]|nr:hypothetical protein [Methylomirabilota bacterium]